MKVVHLTESDTTGGAARAAFRMHSALQGLGLESRMVVGEKKSSDDRVRNAVPPWQRRILQRLDRLPRTLLRTTNETHHTPAWIGSAAWKAAKREKADVFHLHWLGKGYLRLERLQELSAPVVWSLHDMWPFAGGEHYVGSCTRYIEGYRSNNRPAFESGFDLNRWVWERKVRAWAAIPRLTLFPVSHWMAARARESVLFRDRPIEVVHNALDETQFTPHSHAEARQALGLPIDRKLILFGALHATTDTRKGFDLLTSALQHLRRSGLDADLVVFGNATSSPAAGIDLGFKTHSLGTINDPARLSLLYGACDVMVVPSREEAFGQTALEALACGTPVVAFRVGGLPEAVEHLVSGYLATPFDVDDLAQGIHAIVSAKRPHWEKLSAAGRAKVERSFTLRLQAERCRTLYAQALDHGR